MAASMRVRRLVAGAATTGLLAGGAALGLSGTAAAAPAATTSATVLAGDHHDRCEWKHGHWAKKWVKGHWEKKVHWTKTWHKGHHDKHGKWHHGFWDYDRHHKWVYVHGPLAPLLGQGPLGLPPQVADPRPVSGAYRHLAGTTDRLGPSTCHRPLRLRERGTVWADYRLPALCGTPGALQRPLCLHRTGVGVIGDRQLQIVHPLGVDALTSRAGPDADNPGAVLLEELGLVGVDLLKNRLLPAVCDVLCAVHLVDAAEYLVGVLGVVRQCGCEAGTQVRGDGWLLALLNVSADSGKGGLGPWASGAWRCAI